MADDIVTQRLRQLAEVSDEQFEPTGDTLELEQLEFISTDELKQLMDATAEPTESDSERDDLQ